MENPYSMKRTIPDLYKKQLLPLLVLLSCSALIWFASPIVTIANYSPFAAAEKRCYIIALLFLIWGLKFILLDAAPKKNKINLYAAEPEIAKKIHALEGRFTGAVNFLKNTVINKEGSALSLVNLPWYLLIGPEGAGKTSLLTQSTLNFILAKPFKPEIAAAASDSCDWWVTRDTVLVDIPGAYFNEHAAASNKNKSAQKTANILWHTLLKLLKTQTNKKLLNGVILTLNLPELIKKPDQQARNALIQDLKKRVLQLRATFDPQLPFYLIITKCDLLPGFSEFFSESGTDELAQGWGITLPPLQPKEKILAVFTQRFNALIKRLNKQLIWRLQQERNMNARSAIKDFPLHVERLKETITSILRALALPDLCLQGVYLTSAVQVTPTLETGPHLHSTSNSLTHQALQIMQAPPTPSRAYFIRQVLMQGLPHVIGNTTANATPRISRTVAYSGALGSIIIAAALLGHDFQRGLQNTYAVQHELTRYQLYLQQPQHTKDQLAKALPVLDALQQTAQNSQHPFTLLGKSLSFYSNKSQQTTYATYQQALQTILLPQIKNYLTQYLQDNNKNLVRTYAALKTYLMLNNPEQRDTHLMAETVNKMLSTPMNKQAVNQLATHIDNLFAQNASPIQLDQKLIADARKELVNLPSMELSKIILKNMAANNAESVIELGTHGGNPPVFISKQIVNRIPNMFTAANFQTILNEEISTVATQTLKGNWILGAVTPSLNSPTLETLTTQLRNQYVTNYLDIWESLLANIHPFTPKNLLQTDEMIQTLTSNNSPLLQLLKTIQQNTALVPLTTSPKIQALNSLVSSANHQQGSLYRVFADLQQLHVYLQHILTAAHVKQAAFYAAAKRMQNSGADPITTIHQLAEQNPEPLKTWLHTIANESWGFVLQKASEHIEEAWQTQIIPTYRTEVAKHYPFNPNSKQAVSLTNLTRFLGQRGTLPVFYQTYLHPFINDTDKQWAWRILDKQKIPLANKLLVNLQQVLQLPPAAFVKQDNKNIKKGLAVKVAVKQQPALSSIQWKQLGLPQTLVD